jgi:hypothetical protein
MYFTPTEQCLIRRIIGLIDGSITGAGGGGPGPGPGPDEDITADVTTFTADDTDITADNAA